jgi:drug/metabolite transporter (DMT)-like permease
MSRSVSVRGAVALIAGIVLFSTIEVTAKVMQTSGGNMAGQYPFWLAFFRFILTGLVLLPLALRGLKVPLKAKDLLAMTGLGLVGVTLMSSLFHLSLTYLPANVAALVFSCNSVFVILFAPLVLNEKITFRKLLAVALCLGGIAFLAKDHADGISVLGLMLMLGAIVVFAVYTLLFKIMTPRYGALPVTALASLIGALFLLPVAWVAEGMPLPDYAMADWLGIAVLSLFGTAGGYFLYIYGISHVEAGWGSMSFFLKPFLAALFAWVILGEALTVPMMISGAFILSGMAVALLPVRRRNG